MSESRGTHYLDLSDRMLLAQEGIEMIDISIERMAVKMIKQGADPEDEESPESTDFVDGTYRLQQSDLEDKHDRF